MNTQAFAQAFRHPFFRLDTGEQEDELEDAEREEKEARERGEDQPDEDLIRQERLNQH